MAEISIKKCWVFQFPDHYEQFARNSGLAINTPDIYTHIIITDDVHADASTFGAKRAEVVVFKFEDEHEYNSVVLVLRHLQVGWCAWDSARTVAVIL